MMIRQKKMTQYLNKVNNRRELIKKEAWGKTIKYMHANKSVIEIGYNNGTREIIRDQ